MPRLIKLSLLLLPLLAALVVLIDTPYHRLSNGALSGVVRVKPLPKPSLHELWEGSFQSKLEGWLEQQLSFKPAMIRTDNSISLLGFRDISAHTGIPIILGNDDTLFEMNYVNNANGVSDVKHDPPPKSDLSERDAIQRIALASRAFRSLGMDFMLFMYPSKGWLWRDRLPRRYRLPGGARRADAGYQKLLAAFRAERVPVIDGAAAYAKVEKEYPDLPLYNRGGTHWTNAGACQVAKLIVARLPEAKGRSKLRCELGPAELAHGTDADLASLINVWDNQRFLDLIPESRASLSEPLAGGPRKALIVGTSFSSHLIRALGDARVLGDDVERFTYYRTSQSRRVKWKRVLHDKNLVIFEQWQWAYLTINLTEFVDDLRRHDERFDAAFRRAEAEADATP
jgi:SGNH hydrolase-like domain, acetyltransferase AlgX